MKIKTIFAVVALLVMVGIGTAQAQANDLKAIDEWKLLGTRTVDYTLDRDVVTLKEGKETFTSLKFIVKNGKVNMRKATVHFSNGDNQDVDFSDELSKINDGQKIDLPGNKRSVNKVTFWYDTKMESKNRSIVELWGKS